MSPAPGSESAVPFENVPLDALPIPVLVIRRRDGRLLAANATARDFFSELGADVTNGVLVTALFRCEAAAEFLERLRTTDTARTDREPLLTATGDPRWASVTWQAGTWQGEAVVLLVACDVTRQKQAELQAHGEQSQLAELLELAQRDRQLIGYEIHDGIVQEMTAATMFLEAAHHEIRDQKIEIPEPLIRGVHLVRDAIREARRLIGGLQTPALDEGGIVPAISQWIEDVEARSGLSIQFDDQVQIPRLAPQLELAIFRIVQESLNNVWHHSDAATATVRLERRGDQIEIRVSDQGVGFDPTQVSKKRFGLAGIRERARVFGGTATIDSAPGAGTRVTVTLPLTIRV